MNFNKHSELEGLHAFLSPSSYHWLNYDDEKLAQVYKKHRATLRGTQLHEFAKQCITLNIRLPRTSKTLNLYVNDAIGFKMTPEQPLFYSWNAFGTADAIAFKKNTLRIHDLKTGDSPTSMKQLEIYAAYFCLEYHVDPESLDLIELRIYQNDAVQISNPSGRDIRTVMDITIQADKRLDEIDAEEGDDQQ